MTRRPNLVSTVAAVAWFAGSLLAGPPEIGALCQTGNGERLDWHPVELVAIHGSHRARHWYGIHAVDWSHDGQWLATAGADGMLAIWDAETLRPATQLIGMPGPLGAIVFSHDDRLLAAGVDIFSRDGNLSQLRIYRFDAGSLVEIARFGPFDEFISAIEFSHDSRSLVADAGFRRIQWVDLTGAEPVLAASVGTPSVVYDLSWSPDSERLAIACDQLLLIWDASRDTPVELDRVETDALCVAFAPDGQSLATGSSFREETLRIWRWADETLTLAHEVEQVSEGGITSLTYAPNGRVLAADSGHLHQVSLWKMHMAGYETWQTLSGHTGTVYGMAFAPNSDLLATVSGDQSLRTWMLEEPVHETAVSAEIDLETIGIASVCEGRCQPLHDENRVLITTEDGPASYDLDAGRTIVSFDLPDAAASRVPLMVATNDGEHLLGVVRTATGEESPDRYSAVLWETRNGELHRRVDYGETAIRGAAFDPTGRRVAIADTSGETSIYDASTMELVASGQVGEALRWIALIDHQTLLTIDFAGRRREPDVATLKRWRVLDRGLELIEEQENEQASESFSLAISPGVDRLALKPRGGNIEIWKCDASGLRKSHEIEFADRQYFVDSISPDGQLLSISTYGHSTDDIVAVWDLDSGRQIRAWDLPGNVTDSWFSSDSRSLITVNQVGTIYEFRFER